MNSGYHHFGGQTGVLQMFSENPMMTLVGVAVVAAVLVCGFGMFTREEFADLVPDNVRDLWDEHRDNLLLGGVAAVVVYVVYMWMMRRNALAQVARLI